MTEKEKMISGELYNSQDPQLKAERLAAKKVLDKFNKILGYQEKTGAVLKKIIKANGSMVIEPPFYFDYGYNITIGNQFYANFGCIILDVCKVTIGDNVMLGPNVQIYTATHPLSAKKRLEGLENGKEIVIGNNVWIGGGSILYPGVKIGDNSVIAAGSVVIKDVGPDCLFGGNPAHFLKKI
jgi:maltose O-acetyltransferase